MQKTNPLLTGNYCDNFKETLVQYPLIILPVTRHISSIYSSNSEANASELLEHIEEMFSRYYVHGSSLISLTK